MGRKKKLETMRQYQYIRGYLAAYENIYTITAAKDTTITTIKKLNSYVEGILITLNSKLADAQIKNKSESEGD